MIMLKWYSGLLMLLACECGVFGTIKALHITAKRITQYSIYGPELYFAASMLSFSAAVMIASRILDKNYADEDFPLRRAQIGAHEDPLSKTATPEKHQRHLIDRKLRSPLGLLLRDIGPLTFDVASFSDLAEVNEYHGIIHWHRDVIEKVLSLFLVALFSVFFGRALFFCIAVARSSIAIREAINHDMNIIPLLIGLTLILDGIILVAAMSDAPGIGKALDSLIVVLSGVIIVMLNPNHSPDSAPSLEDHHIGLSLILAVAGLFLVRWIIRHHTIMEWLGPNQRKAKDTTIIYDASGKAITGDRDL